MLCGGALALISTQVATTYVFQAAPGELGWANCTVNDATGELSIQSDWGSWTHGWSPDPKVLGAPSLTAFIGSRGDVDYLARKLQREGRDGRRWSVAGTARALRRQLCKRRWEDGREQLASRLEPEEMAVERMLHDKEGLPVLSYRYIDAPTWNDPHRKERLPYLTRDTGRRLWNAIGRSADDCGLSAEQFFEQVLRLEGFTDYVTDEPWQYGVSEQTPEDRALREIVLPALIQACRERVVAGAGAVVVGQPGGNVDDQGQERTSLNPATPDDAGSRDRGACEEAGLSAGDSNL